MTPRVTAQRLYEQLSERLDLRWLAGRRGPERAVAADDTRPQRPSLVGYLNLIHPNKVQVLGPEELQYLDALDSRRRWSTIAEIMTQEPTALIVTDGLSIPDDLRETAEETGTPVLTSRLPGRELLNHLQYFLDRALARRTTLHGVFMEVLSIGVLLTGDSGSGKSELALELLSRGHRLIADDAPELTLIAPDVLDGRCPPVLQDCLEVRGLGVLDVRAMFGDSAVKPNKYLRLIIHLGLPEDGDDSDDDDPESMKRLRGTSSFRRVIDVDVPVITLPVAPGRNLAVLVEAAVRNHILKLKGYDPAQAFIERQERHLRDEDHW